MELSQQIERGAERKKDVLKFEQEIGELGFELQEAKRKFEICKGLLDQKTEQTSIAHNLQNDYDMVMTDITTTTDNIESEKRRNTELQAEVRDYKQKSDLKKKSIFLL